LKETSSNISDLVRVKIADFAHVFPAENTLDENFLFGLNKLNQSLFSFSLLIY
jgi:hypothetical protein